MATISYALNRIGADDAIFGSPGLNPSPALAALPGGGFAAAWNDPSANLVLFERFDASGAQAGPLDITGSNLQGAPAVAGLANGSAVAVFGTSDSNGSITADFGKADGSFTSFTVAAGKAGGLVPISNSNPAVASLGDGSFVVAYQRLTGATPNDVRAQLYDAQGVPRGGAITIAGTTADEIAPSVAGLTGGSFVVTYVIKTGAHTEIWFQICDGSGAPVSYARPVDAAGDTNDEPDVIGLPDGGFAVAYGEYDTASDTSDVAIRVFDAAGTPRGQPVLVYPALGDWFYDPAIAALSNGFLVVAHEHSANELFNLIDPNAASGSQDLAFAMPVGMAAPVSDLDVTSLDAGRLAIAWSHKGVVTGRVAAFVRTTTGDASSETLSGDAILDDLQGQGGNDTLEGGAAADTLDGGAGFDLASGAHANGVVYVELRDAPGVFFDGTGSVDSLVSIEGAIGGTGNDFLNGSDAANQLFGGAGQDALLGRAGGDSLDGGAGDDYLMGGSNYDPTELGSGDDSLAGGDGSDLIYGMDGADTVDGGAGQDFVLAGSGSDTVEGGPGDDFLFAGSAYDFDQPTAGNDTVNGGEGNDYVVGGQGTDLLAGQAGNDILYGGSSADSLSGGDDNDFAFAEAGNDTVAGGTGFDYLYGGAGADRFIFNKNDSYDSVFDFSAAEGDKLELGHFGLSLAQLAAIAQDTSFGGVASTTIDFFAVTGTIDKLTLFGIGPTQLFQPGMILDENGAAIA